MPPILANAIRRCLPLRYDKWGRNTQDEPEKNEGEKVHEPRKRPNQQPPELDKLWKDFTNRLNRIFKRKKKNPFAGGGPEEDYPRSRSVDPGWIGLIVVFATIVGIWMASGFYVVQDGQVGVVTTFGKYSHTTTAGTNWRWPWPVQSHEIVNQSRVRSVEVGYRNAVKAKQPKEAQMLTRDENIVEVQFEVQYRVKNPLDWVFNVRDQDDGLLRQIAESAMREAVGKTSMDEVLGEGRERLAQEVQGQMQAALDRHQAGVQITGVNIQSRQPPEQVQAAFDEADKASQDRKRMNSEGQAYAAEVTPKARAEAARMIQEAEGYRSRLLATAEGDTARFKLVLAEYQKAPGVTRDRMYLETMQQIFTSTNKVLMDAKGSNLNLTMDRQVPQPAAPNAAGPAPAAPAPAPAATAPAPAPAATAPASTRRPRETREREGR